MAEHERFPFAAPSARNIHVADAIGAPTEGMLAVSVLEGGRAAAIQFVPADDHTQRVSLHIRTDRRGDAAGSWLVAPCAAAIRTSENSRTEMVAEAEPTGTRSDSGQIVAVEDVVDPWIRRPARRPSVTWLEVRLGDEVVDPWTGRVDTRARSSR